MMNEKSRILPSVAQTEKCLEKYWIFEKLVWGEPR